MDNLEIKQLITSGAYFEDARRWYISRYVFAFNNRASFVLLVLLILIGLFVAMETAKKSYTKMYLPFPIYAKDEVNFFPIIKSLAIKTEPVETSVARYFVAKYLELREKYYSLDFSDENKIFIFNKVKALSSKKVFYSYNQFIDPDLNPDSPIIRYKNQVQRIIDITSIKLDYVGGKNIEQAEINFIATEKSRMGTKQENFTAKINFIISDLTKVFENKDSIYFIVTDYKTYKLSK